MKVFAVYAKVELTKKPDWLDNFRRKYDEPYEYHITLKQPCIIEDGFVPEIKNKLNRLFSDLKNPNHKMVLTFDSLNIPMAAQYDICIMINATKVDEIKELQKCILSALCEYSSYLDIKYKAYEENFQPHITIGRNLNEQSFLSASKDLKQDFACEGAVTEIVLGVVENDTATEASDPNNQTVFYL